MTTIADVVNMTRSSLLGGLTSPITTLASPYTPGDATLTFQHERSIAQNAIVCAGLTTFIVTDGDRTSKTVSVIPSVDGSTQQALPVGTVCLLRPAHTTWNVFQQVSATIDEIGSPASGLFGVGSETFASDIPDGTYILSETPRSVLRVRELEIGTDDTWHDIPFTYQPGAPAGPTVLAANRWGPTTVQIQYATKFSTPTSLSDTLASLGMEDRYATLLSVGAARLLALASESRRSQPFSQGDPRRADEVPISGNAMVYDRLTARFRDLVNAERSRLRIDYPWVGTSAKHVWTEMSL